MKNMLQLSLVVLIILFSSVALAQNVGIGTSTPDPSAKLEVNSSSSGILVPRVALVATNNGFVPIASPTTSLLVYNTATAGVAPNDVTPGFYYWDGYWVRLSTGSASNDWTINGNSGTIDGTNFIGTTDNAPFNIRVNNIRAGRIDQNNLNTSFGYRSLLAAGGSNTVAIGDDVMSGLYGGANNVGVGHQALMNTTTGNMNVGIGSSALQGNTTGGGNIAIGYNALITQSNGNGNVGIGVSALEFSNGGEGNTAVGYSASRSNNVGQYNTAIGAGANMIATSGSNNTMVGYLAGASAAGSDNTVIGYQSMPSNSAGVRNTSLGSETMYNQTLSNDNTAIGYRSQYTGNASGNTTVGSYALNTNTSGENNTAVGMNAQYFTTTGSRNVSLGKDALYNLYGGTDNTAIGTGAMTSNYNSPVENTAVGAGALMVASSMMNGGGTANTAVGFNANLGGGTGNTSLGHSALGQGGGGQNNVALGRNSLLKESGNENIGIGKDALKENLSGNRNIAIGLEAGINSPGSNNIFIGHQAGFWEYGNDKLHIGNLSSPGLIYGDLANGFFGINTTFAEESMTVAGNLQIGFNNGIGSTPGELQFEAVGGYEASFKPSTVMTENTTYTLPIDGGTNGDVLITDGSGQLSWLTPNMTDSDSQTLGISGNTLSISNGNSITLPASNAWNLTGNGSTVAGTNFIGTTDAVDFVTKTNGLERVRVKSNGLVGIGLNPSYKLDVLHSSTTAEDRAANINYSTSANTGSWNTGLNVISNATANGDLFGILSTATQIGNGKGSAIAGILSGSGSGDKIAIASQIGGSGDDGAGLTSSVSGNWTNAYGLMVEFTSASAIQNRYGIYVKGDVDYSAFMENGNLYVNDNVAIGVNADPPQAKLHVDGNIKSNFLLNSGLPAQDNRILYTNSTGEINPLNNGNPGDVLTINSSNQPEWQPAAPTVFFKQLSSPLYINSPSELIISKSFDTFNDTVTVTLSLSGRVVSSSLANTLPLFPYELTVDVNGSTVSKTYIHPNSNGASGTSQGRFGTSWTVPIPTNYGNNLVEIFITKINPGSMDIEIDPAQGENASLIIMDLLNNE